MVSGITLCAQECNWTDYFGEPPKLADRHEVVIESRTRIRQAQRHLQEAGFAPGSMDGMLGPQTRMALQQYQAKLGLPKTGELDAATRKALGVD
jgi:hypothetical protein